MKIILLSVGKAHEQYVAEGIQDFSKRLNKYFSAEWKIISSVKNAVSLTTEELKKAEAKLILSHIQQDDFLVLLDEKGKMLSSVELADFLQHKANTGVKRLVFLIGGAFGVDEDVSKRANYTWSLSKLVFPHMLVRLILAEQLYRACSILRNEKYHHI